MAKAHPGSAFTTFLLLAVFLIPIADLHGQDIDTLADDRQDDILDLTNTKSEIIARGRTLLLDKFLEGDYQRVKEIKDYLKGEVENRDYLAIFPGEYWFILYWTREYPELLSSVRQTDTAAILLYQSQIKPQEDMLFAKLRSKSVDSRLLLETMIRDSEMTDTEKDFLSMHLVYMLAGDDFAGITQDTLNALADQFLDQYPESEYHFFTRNFIRIKLVPSRWGFAFEFFSGYGILTGSLSESYNNNVPMGVAFDIGYRNLVLYLRDYIGFSRTRTDMDYGAEGTWEKDSQVRLFLPEASLGYVVLDRDHLKMAPFVGIAGTMIGPTQYDQNKEPGLEAMDISAFSYAVGLNLDIKLRRSGIPMVSRGPEYNFWFLRFRYAYTMPRFEQKYEAFGGNMHYLTIGMGGFGKRIKREL